MSDIIIEPQPGPQTQFLQSDMHLVLYGGGGGGGKTWGILADNLRYIHDPNYFSVFFRKTTIELETNLWPEALKMYRPYLEYQSGPLKGKYIGEAKIRDKDKSIVFPSGAKSRFSYMQYDKDADSWYGAELSRAYFDEFQMFSEYQFHVIRSRLRSKAQFPSAMRCTMNPDQSHFVLEFIKRFLDEEGYPIRELSGRKAWFLIVKGSIFTAWNIEELQEKFPGKVPKSYTYIPSTLDDNLILKELEPEYRDTLDSLPEVKRKQMLLGCWFVSDNQATYFDREWLHKADKVPAEAKVVRAWDKASEEPNPNLRYPDYTASVKMYKDKQGRYYLAGGNRFRKKSGERDRLMLNQARADGDDCYVVLPIDPGSSGKDAFRTSTKEFMEEGFIVKKDPMPPNKPKLKKFETFAAAAQNGYVYLVESEWNPDDLKLYLDELESFDGERSTSTKKDDWVDATASAFNTLAKERVIPTFSLGSISSSNPTAWKKVKEELE